MDKSGGLVLARKTEQGTIKRKDKDGILREYNIDDSNDDSDFIFDDALDNLDVGDINVSSPNARVGKGFPKVNSNNIESQLENLINNQVDSQLDKYITKVVEHPNIVPILVKNSNWVNDDDYLNVIIKHVSKLSGNKFVPITIKQALKKRYG